MKCFAKQDPGELVGHFCSMKTETIKKVYENEDPADESNEPGPEKKNPNEPRIVKGEKFRAAVVAPLVNEGRELFYFTFGRMVVTEFG